MFDEPDSEEFGMMVDTKPQKCSRVGKLVLLVFLSIVLVGSIVILGIGIYTHEVEYGSKQLSLLIGVQMYQVDSLMLIGAGATGLFIMILGIMGVTLENKCMLGLHLGILSFLAIMLFVAGVLGYIFIGELEVSVKESLVTSLTEEYGVKPEMGTNKWVTDGWDSVQQRFKCCGAHGNENSSTSWYLYQDKSFWFKDKYSNGSFVPKSCCKVPGDLNLCQGFDANITSTPPRKPPPVLENPDTLYLTGCFDKLEGYLRTNGILIGTWAIVVGVFMLIEMILAICMYRVLI